MGSPEKQSDLNLQIKEFAISIKKRKLEQLAILILEAHKPINTILYSLMLVSEPLLFFISGTKHWKLAKELVKDKALIEELIVELERAS